MIPKHPFCFSWAFPELVEMSQANLLPCVSFLLKETKLFLRWSFLFVFITAFCGESQIVHFECKCTKQFSL